MLDPAAVTEAFLRAQGASVPDAADIYRDVGLVPVPLDAHKRPLVARFGTHPAPQSEFLKTPCVNLGLITGDLGAGLCAFDHDHPLYRDAFLSLGLPTLGIGRAGELRKSLVLVVGDCPPAKRCNVPQGHTVDGAGGELGCLKAGANDTQHQVVVPPGVWHGAGGETQALEVVIDEEIACVDASRLRSLVQQIHERVYAKIGAPAPDVWGHTDAVRPRTEAVQPDAAGVCDDPAIHERAKEALRRLADKLRAETQPNSGRTDLLWTYACIAGTYCAAGLLEYDTARHMLAAACSRWGEQHSTSRVLDQIERGFAADPSRSALEDIERWRKQGRPSTSAQRPTGEPAQSSVDLHMPDRVRVLEGRTDAYVGDALLADLPQSVSTGAALYSYDAAGGIWHSADHAMLCGMAMKYSGCAYTTAQGAKSVSVGIALAEQVSRYVRMCPSVQSPRWLSEQAPGLATKSGFINAAAEVSPHSPTHRALARLDVEYDPDAPHDRLIEFLEQVFLDDHDAMQKIWMLQEFLGLCLLGLAPRAQTAVVLYGAGGNGKGKLLQILRSVLPTGLRSAVSPHDLTNPYYRTSLIGSRINIADEMPLARMQRSDVLKALISGDEMQAEAKYAMPVIFRPMAGYIFAANELPTSDDISAGFFRRFCVLSFNRAMHKLPEKRDDIDEYVSEQAAGILAWAVAGAQRYMKSGSYTSVPSSGAILEQWRSESDSCADFVSDRLTPAGEMSGLSNRELYTEYTRFCERHGIQAQPARRLQRALRACGYEPYRSRAGRGYDCLLKGGMG